MYICIYVIEATADPKLIYLTEKRRDFVCVYARVLYDERGENKKKKTRNLPKKKKKI